VNSANAGLDALNQGDTKTAIRLFTEAITSGSLSRSDLEYAYLERGKAYVQRNSPDHARRDADEALNLKPGDPDAVALWHQTSIEVMPDTSTSVSPTEIIYSCSQPNAPDPRHYIIFHIDVDKATVKSPNFGEVGRKLNVNILNNKISWHSHEEGVNGGGGYGDQFLQFDPSTGVLRNSHGTSGGQQSVVTYICSTTQ
jgi:tetratricopeptide (TPR) repeat protein